MPSLHALEQFDRASLKKWQRRAAELTTLHRALYFDLEPHRQQSSSSLVDSIRSGAKAQFEFDSWSRIVDWQYSRTPLSLAGSLVGDGGRFNVGNALSPETFTPFPALYVAEDFETAMVEKFGRPVSKSALALTTLDLALRKPTSFTQYRLRGRVTQLIDVGDPVALQPFVEVIKQFVIPKRVVAIARSLGMTKASWLIRSVTKLQQQLTHPDWRAQPAQFDLPSNSQIFGRIAFAAGVHGILYPSARQSGKQCLALFPQNWRGSTSTIEVMDPAPEGAALIRLDGTTESFS